MFRLQDNTPQVYINESRDFQLLCRLYDFINNGVMFDIDSMINILDPNKINDRLLNLLATKVGFFTTKEIDSKLLRNILGAFPYLLKYKGSKKAIEMAVSTVLKTEGLDSAYEVHINNLGPNGEPLYEINIYTEKKLFNQVALKEILRYILPVGYTFNIQTYRSQSNISTLSINNQLSYLINPAISTSQIIGSDRVLRTTASPNLFNFADELELEHIGSITSTQVIGTEKLDDEYTSYSTAGTYAKDKNNTNRDRIDESTATNVTVEKDRS